MGRTKEQVEKEFELKRLTVEIRDCRTIWQNLDNASRDMVTISKRALVLQHDNVTDLRRALNKALAFLYEMERLAQLTEKKLQKFLKRLDDHKENVIHDLELEKQIEVDSLNTFKMLKKAKNKMDGVYWKADRNREPQDWIKHISLWLIIDPLRKHFRDELAFLEKEFALGEAELETLKKRPAA